MLTRFFFIIDVEFFKFDIGISYISLFEEHISITERSPLCVLAASADDYMSAFRLVQKSNDRKTYSQHLFYVSRYSTRNKFALTKPYVK